MSGGVDSSVVAGLLQSRGESVIGLTMQLWNQRRLPEIQTVQRYRAVLFDRRCLRCSRRRAAAEDSVLRSELRRPLRGSGGEAVCERVSRRADADSMHAVQQLHQVRPVPRYGGGCGSGSDRDRALRADSAQRGIGSVGAAAGRRSQARIRLISSLDSRRNSFRARYFRLGACRRRPCGSWRWS